MVYGLSVMDRKELYFHCTSSTTKRFYLTYTRHIFLLPCIIGLNSKIFWSTMKTTPNITLIKYSLISIVSSLKVYQLPNLISRFHLLGRESLFLSVFLRLLKGIQICVFLRGEVICFAFTLYTWRTRDPSVGIAIL